MKNTVGLIFLFAVINVSYSATLRELAFMRSLYPRENLPNMLVTSMVNRRIDQVRSDYERKYLLKDARTFYNSTIQSLELLMESMNANDTRNGEFFESYSHIVKLITDVNNIMSFHNVDYLTVNSRDSFPRDELQEMMDAYIADIEMVRMCEVSMGRADRVDMKIVERIKSLSNEVQNYYFYRDDNVFDTQSIEQRTLDQCLWQFKFFLNKFTETFTSY